MSLVAGQRLGPYEVLGPLGAGGMGEVFRARDSRLNREVAIKSLPELFSVDPERVSRFEREAHLLAALNHPNIAGIYGVEELQGTRHLVLELVPGESLGYRIASGPLPLLETLSIARQIAEALEAAHDKGIIHRDLKPGNVMLTPDGHVKVLDFGLAKALEEEGAIRGVDDSPTMAKTEGMIVGTAAYMSPEQAKGRPADKRSDVWAFGCVLFEMLSGKKAYEGEDISETLAAVLRDEAHWSRLPATTPPFLERLLRRCLERDRKKRLPDISIARYEIDEYLAGRSGSLAASSPAALSADASAPAAPNSRLALVALAAAAIGVLLTAIVFRYALTPAAPAERVVAFAVTPPGAARAFIMPIGPAIDVMIARDASLIVYRVNADQGTALALRRISEAESTILPGTTGAASPSLSPDGSKVAFQLEGRLMALTVGSAAPVVVCPMADAVIGTTWLDKDTILFADRGIFKVAAAGGTPESLFAPDKASSVRYTFPQALPGGAVLFTVNDGAQRHIAIRDAGGGELKTVVQNASYPRYADGHLFFVQNGKVVAARWNDSARQVEGTPAPVNREVAMKLSGAASFDVAGDGTFVGMSGASIPYRSRFIWKSQKGEVVGNVGTEDVDYPRYPRLSPNGKLMAATIGVGSRGELWVFDLAGSRPALKLTTAHHNLLPSWTPDGGSLVFRRITTGVAFGAASDAEGLMMMPSDGSSLAPRSVVSHVVTTSPVADVSPDGQWLLYSDARASGSDILMQRLGGDAKEEPKPWLAESFAERSPAFSPDGAWVAYVSEQTGSPEVWVRPFPGPGAPIRVSATGGQEPVWARSGKELYFQERDKLMAAAVTSPAGAVLQFSPPRLLFRGGFIPYQDLIPRTYDVAADGRFLMIEDRPNPVQATVTVIIGWASTLTK